VGVYAVRTFGREGVIFILLSVMALWTIIPFVYAFITFSITGREES
jgi:hypothetical protein